MLGMYLFFEQDIGGWSEVYWNSASNYTEMRAPARKLLLARGALLGNGATLTYARISDPTVKRDVIYPVINGSLPIPGSLGRVDPVGRGALFGLYTATPTVWSRRILRGVPDSAIDSSFRGGIDPGDKFWGAFADFKKILEDPLQKWCVKTKANSAIQITLCPLIRATTKHYGRPFAQPRGRRRRTPAAP